MRSLTDRLKEHRQAIEDTHQAQAGKDSPSSRMIRALCSALLTDFDEKFPEINFTDEKAYWTRLLEKYAKPWPGCPICGQHMQHKKSKFGKFWGCTTYPSCTGARRMDKSRTPTINEEMKLYLMRRKQEEGLDQLEDDRFVKLITDG